MKAQVASATTDRSGIDTALPRLFGAAVATGWSDPAADYVRPFVEETRVVARATSARQREFAAGRAALRDAMSALGVTPVAVPNGSDRAPRWPAHLTGSLSHSDELCVAVIAHRHDMRSLGVDVEPDAPLEDELVPEITTLAERAWLSAQPAAIRGRLARLIFSAKESAYKCQYQVSGAFFEFDGFEVTPDADTGQFEATLLRDVPGFERGHCFHGRFALWQGQIITATGLPQGPRWRVVGGV